MSPLKISLLLRMYSRPEPNADLPSRQAVAPAMWEAVASFKRQGLIPDWVTAAELIITERPWSSEMWLTDKGRALVQRYLEIEP
jgi:hypothetical protein